MESFIFENRDYFLKRIHQLESSRPSSQTGEIPAEASAETSVCVRIRPLTEHEIEENHLEGVLGHDYGVANIYEPRRRFNGKPDLIVRLT